MQPKNFEKEFALSPNPLVRFLYERFTQKCIGKADATNNADISRARNFFNYLTEHNLDEWDAHVVDGFIQHLEEFRFGSDRQRKYSPKTINNYYSVLNVLSSEAHRYKLSGVDLMEGVKGKKYKPKKRKSLRLNNITAVVREGTKICEASAIGFELHCRLGLRISEYLALTWQDVSLKDKTIKIQRALVNAKFKSTKTDSSKRTINLNDDEVELLVKLWALTGNLPKEKVFVTDESNEDGTEERFSFIICHMPTGRRYKSVKDYEQRFCKKAFQLAGVEFKGRGTNIPRHTFASQTRSSGVPDFQVADQMGHSIKSAGLLDMFYTTVVTDNIDITVERQKCFSDLIKEDNNQIKVKLPSRDRKMPVSPPVFELVKGGEE